MSDGVKGGDVNRPGSRPEIAKLPRERCKLCGLTQARPMVRDGRCQNLVACRLRVERDARRKP